MLTYKPNIVLSNKEYNVIGTRPIRHDGAEKVTGQAGYGADVRLPGLLYGKILRSPHAHARIKSIDTRHADGNPRGACRDHLGRSGAALRPCRRSGRRRDPQHALPEQQHHGGR